jgi:hypothetical protein
MNLGSDELHRSHPRAHLLRLGRDPADLRHSLVMWAPLDPWAASDAFEAIVSRSLDAGMAVHCMRPAEDRCGYSGAPPPQSRRSARREEV